MNRRSDFWHALDIFDFGPTGRSQFCCARKRAHHQPRGQARPLIAVMAFQCSEKSWHLIERHRLVSARSTG